MRLRTLLIPLTLLVGGCALANPDGEARSVCIVRPLDHPSLGAAIDGFRARLTSALPKKAVAFRAYNADGDMARVPGLLQRTVRDRCALVFVLTTPAAQAARTLVAARGIPVVYAAVTDPVGAGIVQSMESDTLPVTGVTDLFPVDAQVALFLAADPAARSAALLYNPKEQNSRVLVARTEAALRARHIIVFRDSATDAGAVPEVAAAAARSADMLIINGDNLFTEGLEAVVAAAQAARKPLFAGDPESVSRGAVATISPDYQTLGEKAGDKAWLILSGKRPAGEIPSENPSRYNQYVNPGAARRMGLELPPSFFQMAKVWVGRD